MKSRTGRARVGVVSLLLALMLAWYSCVPNGDCGATTDAINNGKQLYVGLYFYAKDHDGVRPSEFWTIRASLRTANRQ